MDEIYEEYPKLPKNIRQIGELEDTAKVYVEDYVNTYLRRLYPEPGKVLRVGLLLGNLEIRDGTPFLFIDGALEMTGVIVDGERVFLSDDEWKGAYSEIGRIFPKAEILGWFLCAGPGVNLNPISYWNQHGEYFPGKYKLMYLNHTTEQDESIYMTSIEGLCRLRGYCIYYERNPSMQDYMVLRKEARRIEVGVDDSVTQKFKITLQEKKGEANRKKSMRLWYSASSFLLLLVVAGGITMMNNYEKMKTMEVAIANLSQNVTGTKLSTEESLEQESQETKGIVIEHIQGGVSMTEATEAVGATVDASQPSKEPPSNLNPSETATETLSESQPASSTAETIGEPSSSQDTPTTKEEVASIETKESQNPVTDLEAAAAAGKLYVVQEGETLYSICLKQYQSVSKVKEICELNQLENPDKIKVGQKLILP